MKRGPIVAFVLFVTLCVMAPFASAQTLAVPPPPAATPAVEPLPDWTQPGPYVVAQLGAYGPSDDDKSYDVYEPGPGFNGALALGYRFSPFITVQGEIGYQSSSGSYSDWAYNALPLSAVAHLGVPVHNLDLYGLAGIGVVFYNVEDRDESIDEVAMLTKLGCGAAYHFGRWSVGGEVSYQMTNITNAPNDALIGSVTLGYMY